MYKPLLFVIAAVAMFTSCAGNEDKEALGDAQACMNESNQNNVSRCMSKLDGVPGERASLMRCAIKFIEEGYDDSDRIVSVMTELEGNSSGNPTTAALGFLSFRASATPQTNLDNARLAHEYCAKTTAQGFIKLADFSYIATSIVFAGQSLGLSFSETPTEAELKNVVDTILNDPTSAEAQAASVAIGATVISTYEKSCEGVTNPDQFCQDVAVALQESGNPDDAVAVGAALLARLQGTN